MAKPEMAKKLGTDHVTLNVKMKCTFTEDDLEQAVEGVEGELDPTQEVLEALGDGIKYCQEAWPDFEELLGETEDE